MIAPRSLALAALFLLGCAESPREAPSAESAAPAAQASAAATGTPSAPLPTGPDACEDLPEALLRAALALPEAVTVSVSSRPGPMTSSCEYTFSDPSVDPEARRRAAVEQVAQALREGRGDEAMAELARAAGPTSVRYFRTPSEASPEAAREKFEGMMRRLNEGVTHELTSGPASGRSFTLQATTESIPGVGDAAHWSADLHQLFVLSGPRFFQVVARVRPDAAGDLEAAKNVASAILAAERGGEATAPAGAPSAPAP